MTRNAAPLLAVDGFEGPLDLLLELARARRIDLAQLSIGDLVDAFVAALDAALADHADLSRWGEWLVMAATLALLRSRLLLPPDSPQARAARDEAEAMRRLLLDRAAIQSAAAWLEARRQLGRDVFARGGVVDEAVRAGRTTDVTELFRACLVALRVPEQAELYELRFVPLWRVPDATARIARLLAAHPDGATLAGVLPPVDPAGPARTLRCRAALASSFLGALELSREGRLDLRQDAPWRDIRLRPA